MSPLNIHKTDTFCQYLKWDCGSFFEDLYNLVCWTSREDKPKNGSAVKEKEENMEKSGSRRKGGAANENFI